MKTRCTVRELVMFLVFAVTATVAAGQQPREMLAQASIQPQLGSRLPLRATFVDHRGDSISLAEVVGSGRPTVVCLVYFKCPMLCKLAAEGLVRAAASIEQDVGEFFDIAVISFDARDTPQAAAAARTQLLQQYGRGEAVAGWHFLTGQQTAIDTLTQAVGFHYIWDERTGQFSHAAGLVIVAPGGDISGYLDGVRFSPRELSAAIQRAGSGQVSPPPTENFARCYLYDPVTGRFGQAVQWALRIFGLLTVAAIAIGALQMGKRREQANNPSR